jgi:uncharacterized protein (DUF305 family)
MVQRRIGWLVVLAVLAASCAAPRSPGLVATDQTDIWFTQHMIPYLRQTTTVVFMTRPHLADPALARLADMTNSAAQADINQLQGWLDQRGLSPHIHSHQRIDARRQTDLERLSRLRGHDLDLAFAELMAARSRAGIQLTTTEAQDGSLPEVRQLARQMLAEQQTQARQMKAWRHVWTKAHANPDATPANASPVGITTVPGRP